VTRRLFYIAFGAAVGVVAVRRVTAAANRWTPQGIATQAGGIGQQVAALWSEVRELAAEREAELRAGLGLEPADSDDDGANS
jgi:limonene-1,2-epoxide hydrolase